MSARFVLLKRSHQIGAPFIERSMTIRSKPPMDDHRRWRIAEERMVKAFREDVSYGSTRP